VCDYCHRQGHLEEFCFRRKRAERLEKSWRNKDQFHQEGSGPVFPRRVEWSDGRARRVGGGSGDDFGRRVPVGGFHSQAPGHRFGYDFGPPSFEFEHARFERDPCFGSELLLHLHLLFTLPMSRWHDTGFRLTPVSDHLLIHLTVDICRNEVWRMFGSSTRAAPGT